MIVEYATLYINNITTGIGLGVWDNSTALQTGTTAAYGNTSYGTSGNATAVSYRGAENLWGNYLELLEGINIGSPSNYIPWIAPQVMNTGTYAVNTFVAPYIEYSNCTFPTTTPYVTALFTSPAAAAWAFLVAATSSSSGASFCPNGARWTPSTGSCVLMVGGQAASGGYGVSPLIESIYAYSSTASARLQYFPQ